MQVLSRMKKFLAVFLAPSHFMGGCLTSARLFRATLFLAAGLVQPGQVRGQVTALDSIQFAGVAYLARADEIATRFPVFEAMRTRAEASGRSLNQSLLAALQQAGLPLRIDLATRYGLTMSFAVDDEYRVLQPLSQAATSETALDALSAAPQPRGARYRVVTGISGQLLTYDVRENEQVALSAYPVTYEYVDVINSPPGPAYAAQVASQILDDFVTSDPSGVFPQAAAALRLLPRSREARCKVRIAPITYDSLTGRAGQQRFGGGDTRIADALRNLVQRQLVTSAQLPLLPNGDSRARSEMLQRFANGEVFRLTIPEPDFEVVFSDMRTRQMEAGRSASRRVDATGVQVQIAVRVPFDSSIRVRGTYRFIVNDTVPVNQVAGDPWPHVTAAVTGLTTNLGRSMRRRDKEWFKKNDVVGSTFPALSDWLQFCAP